MALLESEKVIDLTTVARVNNFMGRVTEAADNSNNSNPLIQDASVLGGLITMCSRDAMTRLMVRAIQKKSRTEQFDISKGQTDFWVAGSPIAIPTDVDTDITIYKNTSQPRVFTVAGDEVSANYIICDAVRQTQGRVTVEQTYEEATNALQIAYTGGMASATVISGADGASGTNTTFTSASKDFTALGVEVGDTLAITESGDADHGLHTISAVGTTTLTLATALTATASTLDYEIIDGDDGQDTIVGKYPDIAQAVDIQVRYMWQNQGKFGISQEQIAGTMLMSHKPINWLNYPQMVLCSYGKDI